MALQKQINFTGNSVISTQEFSFDDGEKTFDMNCYIKIVRLDGNKENIRCVVSFSEGDIVFFKNYNFIPNMDGGNFIKQAYEYLKTLPEFASAADV
jgi:hypothetical protein